MPLVKLVNDDIRFDFLPTSFGLHFLDQSLASLFFNFDVRVVVLSEVGRSLLTRVHDRNDAVFVQEEYRPEEDYLPGHQDSVEFVTLCGKKPVAAGSVIYVVKVESDASGESWDPGEDVYFEFRAGIGQEKNIR